MDDYSNPMGYEVTPLFDTMLFVPYPNVPDTETGWTNYLNDLFALNLQLAGLYWNEEQYQASAPGGHDLLQAAEKCTHANHLSLFWLSVIILSLTRLDHNRLL
jgi:hypothetical protein